MTANQASERGGLRARIRALPGGRLAWRIGVSIVGIAVIVVGVLLLALPGPGWLIIFAGLGILSTEYAWASRLLRTMRGYVSEWTRWAARQSMPVRALLGIVGLVVIAGALLLSWWVVH